MKQYIIKYKHELNNNLHWPNKKTDRQNSKRKMAKTIVVNPKNLEDYNLGRKLESIHSLVNAKYSAGQRNL